MLPAHRLVHLPTLDHNLRPQPLPQPDDHTAVGRQVLRIALVCSATDGEAAADDHHWVPVWPRIGGRDGGMGGGGASGGRNGGDR